MQRQFAAVMALIMTVLSLPAGAAPPEPLPVEFFAAPAKFKTALLSPDGKHIAFTYEEGNNEGKLAIAKSDLSEITAVYAFGDGKHVGNALWANDERLLMYVWKNTGYLDGRRQDMQIFIGGFDGSNRREVETSSRSAMWSVDGLESDPDHIMMARWYQERGTDIRLYRVNVNTGDARRYGDGPDLEVGAYLSDMSFDSQDRFRAAVEVHPGAKEYEADDDRYRFHYRPVDGQWASLTIDAQREQPEYEVLGFGPGDQEFYFLSNFDQAHNDTMGLFKFDFATGEISLVFRHPDVDVQSAVYGPLGTVLGVTFEPGYPERLYLYPDDPVVIQRQALDAAFPGQEVFVTSFSRDGSTAAVRVSSDRNPGELYLFRDNKLQFLAAAKADADPSRLGVQEAFTLQARDGVKLYGYLTLPPGREDRNLPMVVMPHGGPHGPYDRWGYDPDVQVLASNGYAVLQVNFRGSGGYGQDFETMGHGKWGREMQDDITDATLWAIREGVADRDRICLYGVSYGGYASLMGVVREPDLYQCAIPSAGVYSLPMMRKKGDFRLNPRAANAFLDNYLGTDEDDLVARSPAYQVDKIKADLFIIHGTQDVRVPFDQATFLRDQLDDAGMSYEWMQRDEGHGFTQVDNRIDMYQAMLAFLDKHIGEDRASGP